MIFGQKYCFLGPPSLKLKTLIMIPSYNYSLYRGFSLVFLVLFRIPLANWGLQFTFSWFLYHAVDCTIFLTEWFSVTLQISVHLFRNNGAISFQLKTTIFFNFQAKPALMRRLYERPCYNKPFYLSNLSIKFPGTFYG